MGPHPRTFRQIVYERLHRVRANSPSRGGQRGDDRDDRGNTGDASERDRIAGHRRGKDPSDCVAG